MKKYILVILPVGNLKILLVGQMVPPAGRLMELQTERTDNVGQ